LVGELAVGRLAASFEPKQPTANQISIKIEKRTYASHTRVNLLYTLSTRIFTDKINELILLADFYGFLM
jgi:hypothetical protein